MLTLRHNVFLLTFSMSLQVGFEACGPVLQRFEVTVQYQAGFDRIEADLKKFEQWNRVQCPTWFAQSFLTNLKKSKYLCRMILTRAVRLKLSILLFVEISS